MTGTMNRKTPLALIAAGLVLTGAFAAGVGAQTAPQPAPATGSPIRGDAELANTTTVAGPTGEDVYMRVCAACHMPDAKGSVGAGFYPALAENPRLMANRYPVYVVMNGMNGMPPLGDMLTDEQVADVVNYVRTHFGNAYQDAVVPADVAALR